MNAYHAPVREYQFVLHELLDVTTPPAFSEADDLSSETIDQVIEAAGLFATEVLAPLNDIGDRQGCSMPSAGVVTTPDGFKMAYQQFIEAGWTSLGCNPEHGGQGLPNTVNAAVLEIFAGANMAWAAYPGMSQAAYTCLAANATAAQKELYLPKLVSGEWAGTMCLTEPHAGTDLGLLRTRAIPHDDGTFAITGTKIFISGGEHDLTDNIIHLVLARLPDSPLGVKGISLFLVPKILVSSKGELGERNAVFCGSLEHKMGIHANATCTMNFDGATGYLVGEVNKGLAAMFVMMNHARLLVGVNAIGLMEAAYQKALAYAKDRLQGRSPKESARRGPADSIIEHADVRRMLLTQKAYVEGARAFGWWACQLADTQHATKDPEIRHQAAELSALVTPIVKAFSSDLAVECTSLAMQVFGGHGYIADNHVEQYLRDARIIPLYEGANGIQALDLLGRKVLMDGGKKLEIFLKIITEFIETHAADPEMGDFTNSLSRAINLLRNATQDVSVQSKIDPHTEGSVAVAYLRLVGHVGLGWMWARMAALAFSKSHDSDPIYASKIATARFYFKKLLPEVDALAVEIATGSGPIMAIDFG
ncbi:acyl-CoA dehydrogenase C-terminal domain-containing protein [Cupriavidus sp. 2TAF22]|uniref:acyl-CoA dehydrogenase C-terminal domain-containing protein n=1 Tax=unclassified Cupriavidus TaxID=2640874 RepID=UPI003F92956E